MQDIIKQPRWLNKIEAKGELYVGFTFSLLKKPEEINPAWYKAVLTVSTAEEDAEIRQLQREIKELQTEDSLIPHDAQIENLKDWIAWLERLKDMKKEEYPDIEFQIGSLMEYKEWTAFKMTYSISIDTAIMLLTNIIDLNRYFISLFNQYGTTNQEV